jgi:hypothetical protein
MRRLSTIVAVISALAVSGLGLVAVPTALAAQNPAITDCVAHGSVKSTYTSAQLRNALSTMSADVKEYTDCYDVLQRALLAQIGGSHQSGNGSGSGSGGSFLPTPLIVVLVLLALGAVTFGALAIRRRRSGDGPPSGPCPPPAPNEP